MTFEDLELRQNTEAATCLFFYSIKSRLRTRFKKTN